MTGLVEALVSRFEIKDHFSDIPNASFYILVPADAEVSEEAVKESCDEFNYTYRGMRKLTKDFAELRTEVLG
ncbi:MAG: hypothetical protein KDB07_04675 [Planctomycetes bacterium]|nr:hypothetical protein [Planctomycetota bacterium]